jgi:hypothetical protein
MDLAHAPEVLPRLSTESTVGIFTDYVKRRPIQQWEAERRMLEELERRGFLSDVHRSSLLTRADASTTRAFCMVFEAFIVKIPGKTWKTTPSLLKKHRLDIKATRADERSRSSG